MERGRARLATKRAMEENTMAILDVYGPADSSHLNADRITFLEAVRSACIIPADGPPPTNKMLGAVFEIFRDSKCLELLKASYQLLVELDSCFPRVYLSDKGEDKSSSPNPAGLIIIEEAWSPFAFGVDVSLSKVEKKKSFGPLDQLDICLLLKDLTQMVGEENDQSLDIEVLKKTLLFQYMVDVIEGDFCARNTAFLDTSNWNFLRNSLLSMLLGSRRINYKDLVMDCISVMSSPANTGLDSTGRQSEDSLAYKCNMALQLAFPEVKKRTCAAAQNLLFMMMKLDLSRRKADEEGLTSRVDGIRTSVMEIILDNLTYDRDLVSTFLQALDEPKLKLEIVLNYIKKYMAKPSTRNRSSNGSDDYATLPGVLSFFTNSNNTKSMIKKIGAEEIQVLLAHAFQACMSLSQKQLQEVMLSSEEETSHNALSKLCNCTVSAFKGLLNSDPHVKISVIGKEALSAAATFSKAMS